MSAKNRQDYLTEYRESRRDEANAYAKRWREDPKNAEKIEHYYRTAQSKRKANPEKRRREDRKYRKKAIEEGRSVQGWLIKKYEGLPCMDCGGVFDFIAMDFDHRPEEGKEFGICNLGQYSATPERLAKVEKEVAKCDLVCSNCHRVRTKNRNK